MFDWLPGFPLKLETEHFVVRSLGSADATDEYISWWNDAEVQEPLGFHPRWWSQHEAVRHIGRFDNRRRFHLGIFDKEGMTPVGFITITPKDKGCIQTNIVIGNKEYWGKRVPIEVRETVFDFIFEKLGAHKIVGEVDARNFTSIFNYKAQGFACEGVLREQKIWIDGTRHDLLMFGMLKEDWQARRKGASR